MSGATLKLKQYNLWSKLRSAMRDVWRYSPAHKEAIKKVVREDGFFSCSKCLKNWPKELASLDHNPQLGSFDSWSSFADWTRRLFEGHVDVVDKMCHKKITAQQRKKHA